MNFVQMTLRSYSNKTPDPDEKSCLKSVVLLVSSDCCDSYDNLTPLLRLKIVDRHIAAKYRFETPFCHRGLCRNDEGRTYAQRC